MRRFALAAALLVLALPALASSSDVPPFALLSLKGKPVYCGGARGGWVALTFDDGPGPYTPRLVESLRRAHVRATFFLVGQRVGFWPASARAEATIGVLGNHTWDQPRLSGFSPRALRSELMRTSAEIRAATGVPVSIFRPPYGVASHAQEREAHRLGLLDVRWSLDSGDSRPEASEAAAVATVLAGAHGGSIVLLHDIHTWTADEARQIARGLRARGFRLVTVPDLLDRDPPTRAQLGPNGFDRCP